jgi:hypothetical protein
MFLYQRRVPQHPDAWIFSRLTDSLLLAVFTIASIAVADPHPALSDGRHDVRFDLSPAPIGPGGSLVVTPFPNPTQNVVSPLTFNFTPVGNLLAMQSGTPAQIALANQVVNGFVIAADRWRALFVDPITVTVRTRLGLDAQSLDDVVAVASLQVGPSMDFITNDTSFNNAPSASPRIRDNNTLGTPANNNNYLDISRANAKALGISVTSGADASITFTDYSDFSFSLGWDFDPTNGINAGAIDFIGVATHEIGHTMGFFSGVDIVDLVGSPNGPFRLPANGGPYDLDQYAVYNTLDLYRFSANSLAQSSQPVGGLRDLAYSQSGAGPYFSINGGATNLAQFSTGGFNGDARQASHWKDGLGIGIMDPTFSIGELGVISLLDRRGMDVIGWDPTPVPEPVGLYLSIVAILGLSGYRSSSSIRRVG